MKKEIFSDLNYDEDIAICLRKMMNGNKSFAALRKAYNEAFVVQYMALPQWEWRFKKEDRKSAADLPFSEWLKTVDVCDYFEKAKLLNDLLKGMSADEIKIVLADAMKIYYDAFRKGVTCSVFEEEESSDDGDDNSHEKSESNKGAAETAHNRSKDEDGIGVELNMTNNRSKDEDENEDEDGIGVECDSNDDEDEDIDNEEDEDKSRSEGENGDNDGDDTEFRKDLEEIIDAFTKRLNRFSKNMDKKEGKKKNENKGN